MRLAQPDAPSASGEIRAGRPARRAGPVLSSPHGAASWFRPLQLVRALLGRAGSRVDRPVVGPRYRDDRTVTGERGERRVAGASGWSGEVHRPPTQGNPRHRRLRGGVIQKRHRRTLQHPRVLAAVKARRFAPPRCRGLSALTPAPRTLSGGTCPMMPNHDHASRPAPRRHAPRGTTDQAITSRTETTARKDGPVGRRGHDERTSETTRARLLDSRSMCRAASS